MTGRPDRTGIRVVLGLTGGIGVGKSTAAAIMAELGSTVIDCDDLGRRVVEPDGAAFETVVARFGPEVIGPDGRIDRPALGRIVFSDAGALTDLNAITHPAIDDEIRAGIDAATTDVVVLDMAVLVETSLGRGQYHEVVVVEAPLEQRLHRLQESRGMSADAARARIASQVTDVERRAVADHVIVNRGTQADLRVAVTALWGNRFGPPAEPAIQGA